MKPHTIFLILFLAGTGAMAATNDLPKFDEVYKLLRENLPGVTEDELNQAAVKGLIDQLQPKVSLATSDSDTNEPILARTEVYDGSFAYLRVGRVGEGLADKARTAYDQMSSTNQSKIKGVVLDLRFATGLDYPAAAATANLFIRDERPLLDWGNGSARATAKTNAISVPVAILVNHQTRGAAEALGAELRDANVGLLLGSPTAGAASVYKEFTLANGSRLRIATSPVKVGSGSELSGELTPDIAVSVPLADEKAYMTNAYAVLHRPELGAGGNPAEAMTNRLRRMNEAELVRQQREGGDADSDTSIVRRKEPERAMIADPALNRALDLLKGLAVVQQGSFVKQR